jgi:hypothetical protein
MSFALKENGIRTSQINIARVGSNWTRGNENQLTMT